MYIQPIFEETRLEVIHDIIRSEPLGALTAYNGCELVANHLPFTLNTAENSLGILRTHVSQSNFCFRQEANPSQEVMVIFKGPDAYISPSWLPNRKINGRVQPSWAYVVVHAYCSMNIIRHDQEWLMKHLDDMVNINEANFPDPWSLSEAPKDFINTLLQHIVGVELTIYKLTAKRQLMQQRQPEARRSLVRGLQATNNIKSQQVAKLIESSLKASKDTKG